MSCSDDMTVRIWGMTRVGQSSDSDQVAMSSSLRAYFFKLLFSTLNICRASFDATARLWDADTGACLQVFTHHKKPIYAISFSPDGRWLATGGGDGWFHLYDAAVRSTFAPRLSFISSHRDVLGEGESLVLVFGTPKACDI